MKNLLRPNVRQCFCRDCYRRPWLTAASSNCGFLTWPILLNFLYISSIIRWSTFTVYDRKPQCIRKWRTTEVESIRKIGNTQFLIKSKKYTVHSLSRIRWSADKQIQNPSLIRLCPLGDNVIRIKTSIWDWHQKAVYSWRWLCISASVDLKYLFRNRGNQDQKRDYDLTLKSQ